MQLYYLFILVGFGCAIARRYQIKVNKFRSIEQLRVNVGGSLARITDNYCPSWYISGPSTSQSSNSEAITIPCTWYAPVIVLHKAREALQQLYSWWIVSVNQIILQNVPDLLAGRASWQKIICKFYRVRYLPRHHINGMPQTFVGCLARSHSLKIV